jgi:hypothetical protein
MSHHGLSSSSSVVNEKSSSVVGKIEKSDLKLSDARRKHSRNEAVSVGALRNQEVLHLV